jgi:putative addiction module component (TIGR02574 family)
MNKPIAIPPAGFEALSVDQQIDYVQMLWDRIAEAQCKVPSPDWHHNVIRARIAEHKSDSDPGRPWTQVSADLIAKLRQ